MENSEFAFDFYNKGREYNERVFSYLPEAKSENGVPGFERESFRYRKESLLKPLVIWVLFVLEPRTHLMKTLFQSVTKKTLKH